LNARVVVFQLVTFAAQWVLMILGFGILTRMVAALKIPIPDVPLGNYLDAGIKALIALGLSIVWLLIWDRQVRYYFYRHNR
jgi:hypothetical protein